jgi:hypothetical protein
MGGGERAVHHADPRALPAQHDRGGPTIAHRLAGRLPTADDDGGLA